MADCSNDYEEQKETTEKNPHSKKVLSTTDETCRIIEPEMCYFCFDVLHCYLNNLQAPIAPASFIGSHPLFVTWKVGKDKRLRGCIGTFEEVDLEKGLRQYAIISAMEDSRFNPIKLDEFPDLHVSVSLLCHFEDGADYADWVLGTHGIRIKFKSEGGSMRSATYLPHVPTEAGWNKIQTIDSLLRKGGYKAPVTPEYRKSIKLVRYQSEMISVSYADYLFHSRSRSQGEN